MSILNELLQTIDTSWTRLGLSRLEPVLLAYSGGRDSAVLLYVLSQLSKQKKIAKIYAARFHHGLRSQDEMDRETEIVSWFTRTLGVELVEGRADENRMDDACQTFGLEGGARILRYEFLEDTARRLACPLIAFGHHQRDQQETLIARFFAGSGLSGLAGIPARRRVSRQGDAPLLVRPMLDIEYAKIEVAAENLCTQFGRVFYHNDSSNQDNSIQRNSIRNSLLPELQRHFPGMQSSMQRLAGDVRDIVSWHEQILPGYLQEQEEAGGVKLKLKAFFSLPPALRSNYLMRIQNRIVPEKTGRISRKAFAAIENFSLSDSSVLSKNTHFFRGFGIIVKSQGDTLYVLPQGSGINGQVQETDFFSSFVESATTPALPDGSLLSATVIEHVSAINFPLMIRSMLPGDTAPDGKKMKKWLQKHCSDAHMRPKCLLIENLAGKTLAVISPEGVLL